MSEVKVRNLIYQYVFHNYDNEFHMMAELKRDNDRMMVHLRAGIVAADQAGEPAIGNFLQDLLDQHQMKSLAKRGLLPQDVADVAFLLCQPESQMIRGQTITVDAGYSIIA